MTLLNPWMLLGLAGLAGPLVLHLINRHRYPVEDFPAIQLLRIERRANRFARRLVDIPELLLRLLVLLLLVLAMLRVFLPVVPSTAPHNLVVVVDSSARLAAAPGRPGNPQAEPLFERARALARELLENVPAPGLGALVAAGDTVRVIRPLMRGTGAAAGVDELALVDGAGTGLAAGVAAAAGLLEGRREAHARIVVLSDLNAVAFTRRNPDELARLRRLAERMGDRLELVFVDLTNGERVENVAVLDAALRGRDVLLGDDARVRVRILDRRTPSEDPDAPAASLPVRLALPGVRDPFVRSVTVEPGIETVVEIAGRMTRAVRGFGVVSVEPDDALPQDDHRGLPLVVSDARHVLIVREPPPARAVAGRAGDDAAAYAGPDGPTVLRYVLNPGHETGGAFSTGIDAQVVASDTLAAQPLGRYSAVILYGVSSLPDEAVRDLRAFVRDGRAVLLVAGEGVNPLLFNRSMTVRGAGELALLPFQVGAMQVPESPVALELARLDHPVPSGLDDALRGDLDMVRFARFRTLPALEDAADGVRVVLRARNGAPLIVESVIGRGRVLTLLFGLEAADGNLARTRVFPHLVWRLLDHAQGRLDAPEPDRVLAGRPVVLDVSEPEFAFLESLELSRQPLPEGEAETAAEALQGDAPPRPDPLGDFAVRRYPIRADRTIVVDPLPVGRYLLHRPRSDDETDMLLSYARPLAVNPDTSYAGADPVDAETVRDLFGPGAGLMPAVALARRGPRGAEGWSLLVLLGLAAYLVEGVRAHRAGLRRATHPDTGGAA